MSASPLGELPQNARRLTITPQMAKEMLAHNECNRPVKQNFVQELAGRMKRGEWLLNGQTIIFSTTGRLLDGQHRLLACVLADCSFETYVVYGMDEKVFATIDDGRSRSASDVLALSGEMNTAHLAATLRVIHNYKLGEWNQIGHSPKWSNAEMLRLLGLYPQARTSVALTHQSGFSAKRVNAAAHYLFAEIDNDTAALFFMSLYDGTMLRGDDPIYLLRERLRNHKLTPISQLALHILAWNAHRKGRFIKQLHWRSNGPTAMDFPKPL